jgi:hypothetical protein
VDSDNRGGEGHNSGRGVPFVQASAIAEVLREIEQQTQISRAALAAVYTQGSVAQAMMTALAYRPMPTIGDIIRLQDISLAQATRRIAEYNKTMQLLSAAVKSQEEVFARIRAHMGSIRFMTAELSQLRSPIIAIAANVELISQGFQSLRNMETLMALALRPTWELQRLTGQLARTAARRGSPGATVAELTIEAAALQTTRASEAVAGIVRHQAPWLVTQPRPETLPTFNLFAVQQEEIHRLIASPLVGRLNIKGLPSAVPATLARYLCHLVVVINALAVAKGGEPIFKPTNRLVEGAAGLPFIVATSQVEFQDFINLLFQMLYEGSGEAKRLTRELADGQLGPLWRLKQVRLWAFHDVAHGNDRKSAENQRKIAEAFRQLIGKPAPESEDDYRIAQVRLLDSLMGMLKLLRDKVSGR